MAIYGLYDIDLWHKGRSVPNLELMQTYAYLSSKNERVIMMKPNEDEEKFSQIIYFKDNPNVALPKTLNVYGEKKSFFGYGFFNKAFPLKPEIAEMPPSYIPYDAWTNKIGMSVTDYEKMKRSALIRFETDDLTDLKHNPITKHIYLADRNFLKIDGAEEFLQQYKNCHFNFLHSLITDDYLIAQKFMRYSSLFNKRIVIDGPFPEDFFYEYCGRNIIFSSVKFPNEKLKNYQLRMIKIILWHKCNNYPMMWPLHQKEDELTELILAWGKDNSNHTSFADYYISDKNVKKIIMNCDTDIRILLKQNPKTVTRSILDLKANL